MQDAGADRAQEKAKDKVVRRSEGEEGYMPKLHGRGEILQRRLRKNEEKL